MPKVASIKRYTSEFEKLVVETMLEEKLSHRETAIKAKLKGLPSTFHRQQASLEAYTIVTLFYSLP